MEDNRLIETDEDREDFGDEEEEEEQDEEYEEGEEVAESIRVARIIHRDLIENEDDEDEDEDEYYEDDDDEEEDYEEEEIEDLILVRMPSQGAEVINNDFLDDLNNLESCEGKRETSEGEIGGLFCPICFQAWTSGGEHRICCLPCGHIYGLSCIKKWLQLRPSSRKCPQCNSLCTFEDVRVLYTVGLCVADEKLQNKVQSLEAKCASLEQQNAILRELAGQTEQSASSSNSTPRAHIKGIGHKPSTMGTEGHSQVSQDIPLDRVDAILRDPRLRPFIADLI